MPSQLFEFMNSHCDALCFNSEVGDSVLLLKFFVSLFGCVWIVFSYLKVNNFCSVALLSSFLFSVVLDFASLFIAT